MGSISVRYVDNSGGGSARTITVAAGSTVEEVISGQGRRMEDVTVRYTPAGGESRAASGSLVVEDGSRLSVTPNKVAGA